MSTASRSARPGARAGDLDHHVGLVESPPQVAGLGDGRFLVVGEIGSALEGDEAVASLAGFIDGAQLAGGCADVVERQREKQLLGIAPAFGGQAPQLLVVEV